MSSTQNKALLRRLFEEGMNGRNLRVFDELIAPGYVNHDFPQTAPGNEGFKQVVDQFFHAFPDLHVTLDEVFAEGDRVGSRGHFTGTHRGDFQGIPPTGRSVKVAFIDVWRVEGGRFVENWVQMDRLGLMQQLGVIPEAAHAEG